MNHYELPSPGQIKFLTMTNMIKIDDKQFYGKKIGMRLAEINAGSNGLNRLYIPYYF